MAQPQTTNGMAFSDVEFYYQIEGDPTPTEASGFLTQIEIDGFELSVGETYTASGTGAIMTAGKISPAEITASMVYTEEDSDPTDNLWDAKIGKKKVKFIWYPQGKKTGNWEWATDYGYLTGMTPPAGEAGSEDAVLVECVLKCGTVTKSAVAA